ncbi:hypothetical protein BpHYR1_054491 [Brachionus plicatilis]|uniref:Uncharacterized protein n=1 Tax=Brachionus plicatilis TaxID=10195 RepID=A0A3M7S810_BRAPC|nr:hypothetical protein BpHYR1_054491 [Brachionus plicatilis]
MMLGLVLTKIFKLKDNEGFVKFRTKEQNKFLKFNSVNEKRCNKEEFLFNLYLNLTKRTKPL